MKTIITIQHTQAIYHTNGMVGSWTDWSLTESGVLAARRIGEKLKAEFSGKRFVIYSSDLLRAMQTADMVSVSFGVKPTPRWELRERNLGKACRRSVQWMRENQEVIEKTPDDRLFADAESRRDQWNRLATFFEEIMSGEEENIIIVAHSDLLAAFYAMFMGLDAESLFRVEAIGASGGVSVMTIEEDGKRCIRRLNDMSYAL